ncbi:MAG: DNA translocase FtsK [Opitutales bacterium]|nr:DNA translocase FtsK [Opitutales bacterium]
MPKKSTNSDSPDSPKTPNFGVASRKPRPLLGLLCLFLGLFLLVALADYQPSKSPRLLQGEEVSGSSLVGSVGVEIGHFSFLLLGGTAWLLPILLFWLMWIFFSRRQSFGWIRGLAFPVLLLSAAGLWSMQDRFGTWENLLQDEYTRSVVRVDNDAVDESQAAAFRGGGGSLGHLLYYRLLYGPVGVFGSAILFSFFFFLALAVVTNPDLQRSRDWAADRWRGWQEKRRENAEERTRLREARKEEKEKARQEKEEAKAQAKEEKAKAKSAPEEEEGEEVSFPFAHRPPAKGRPEIDPEPLAPPPVAHPPAKPAPARKETVQAANSGKEESEAIKIVRSASLEKAKAPQRKQKRGEFIFPDLKLLTPPADEEPGSRENHEETAKALIHTLQTFGVEAKIDEVHVGPVITRYDILPAAGTKVSKIQNLENDIAMGLKALAVRILAPVPGKGCVGIEVPNKSPLAVCLRDILESKDWETSRAEIPIGLGKDVSGKPLVADLTKMPHLLIAGSTGSGKTVCINSIIASLLYHATPEELRFIMVDPKIVEMKVFNDLPHMLIPVVTEPKKVPAALKWLLQEMEKRYRMFAKAGVRNITGYRNFIKKKKEEEPPPPEEDGQMDFGDIPEAEAPRMAWTKEDEIELPEKLPYIVCIIDELADLMMVAPAEIEQGIARLAQLARAAGIHLILATQRPSVNVITGVIKANLPSRISFKVASKVDSRTILDSMGADQLIGRGDMLFLPPGSSRLIRSQGAFVSDEEISAIVDHLKQNGPPQFEETVQQQIEQPDGDGDDGDEESDDLYEQALDVLRTSKRASASMLQRRLKIGYNRAATLIEKLEDRGVVGPENGSSPREILVDLDSL